MLKFQIHIFAGGECWLPTFYAESKNPKIPNSHFHRLGTGGDCWPTFDAESKNPKFIFLQVWRRRSVGSQLLMLSLKMLKSQIHIFTGGRGGLKANF